jgi:Uma2 family endonuclease
MAIAAVQEMPEPTWTYAKLRKHFGMIPAERILLVPRPGTATEEDLIHLHERYDRLCELVDRVLLEKPMGTKESILAGFLIQHINNFLDLHDLGVALPPDGFLRLTPGLVRAADVSVILWDSMPYGVMPEETIFPLVPDLAIEVLSKGNTPKEMRRKRQEFFGHGTRLVWQIDPKSGTVEVFTSVAKSKVLRAGEILDGGEVLPGFTLAVDELMAPRRHRRKRG